ncbi:MAG: FtsQ-type POTRA domain-containing protein [Nocardioidaceae bacterium]|nr:FtsQ-type POTRA domain-containing protein [Nocardioidaceae bacterium]
MTAAAVFGFAGWVVFFSSWLATEVVSVKGAEKLSPDDVIATAGVDLGTPLVRINLDVVRDRIADIPVVDSVSVHRSWPHTIEISVTERQPIAAVRRGRGWWVMDKEGVVFWHTPVRLKALPVVKALGEGQPDTLREVGSVLNALPDRLRTATQRVEARTMDSITLRLENGREVFWGSAADSDRKVAVLAVLLDQRAAVYDVSVPARPTTSG